VPVGPFNEEKAEAIRGDLTQTIDPLEDRHAKRDAETINELCNRNLEEHARARKRASSARDDESAIRRSRCVRTQKRGRGKLASRGR